MNSRGFTLIELMISIALLSIMALGTAGFMTQSHRSVLLDQAKTGRDAALASVRMNLGIPAAIANTVGHLPAGSKFSACIKGGAVVCDGTMDAGFALYGAMGDIATLMVAGDGLTTHAYYSVSGEICRDSSGTSNSTAPTKDCPFEAVISYQPICNHNLPCVVGSPAEGIYFSYTVGLAAGVGVGEDALMGLKTVRGNETVSVADVSGDTP
jgi:prepilin-type N-terminal cleavage/methylation domain-containing protein